jgi:hypothetical protein
MGNTVSRQVVLSIKMLRFFRLKSRLKSKGSVYDFSPSFSMNLLPDRVMGRTTHQGPRMRPSWPRHLAVVAVVLSLAACSDYDRARRSIEGGNYAEAFVLYTQLAEAGDERAQYALSQMYFQGLGGQNDSQRAWYWLLTAADGGNVAAMVKLGSIYENSAGTASDHASAAQWYLRAATLGNPVGRFNLALLYLKGIGVPKDEVAALAWFRLALKAGGPAARSWANQLERRLTADELVRVDALVERIEQAAKE